MSVHEGLCAFMRIAQNKLRAIFDGLGFGLAKGHTTAEFEKKSGWWLGRDRPT
jgi:hypothetical protein